MSPRAKYKKSRKDYDLIQRVAGNIIRFRKRMNVSQEQLQEDTGLAVHRYESGKCNMTLTSLGILSKHLDIKPYRLLR